MWLESRRDPVALSGHCARRVVRRVLMVWPALVCEQRHRAACGTWWERESERTAHQRFRVFWVVVLCNRVIGFRLRPQGLGDPTGVRCSVPRLLNKKAVLSLETSEINNALFSLTLQNTWILNVDLFEAEEAIQELSSPFRIRKLKPSIIACRRLESVRR